MFESTWDGIRSLLGAGLETQELEAHHMAIRAVLTFAITVAVLRFGSKRLFNKGTAFDYIVAIMIGSIMSRSITGSTPMVPTWIAGTVLVALHLSLAWLTSRFDWIGPLVKGNAIDLVRDGELLRDGLRAGQLSEKDFEQAVREEGLEPDTSKIRLARLERDGAISVIERKSEPKILEVAVEQGVQRIRIALE